MATSSSPIKPLQQYKKDATGSAASPVSASVVDAKCEVVRNMALWQDRTACRSEKRGQSREGTNVATQFDTQTQIAVAGTTVIPASKRPDGTWRKPIRVKDGFVPQEEIPVYKTRQETVRSTVPSGPFGLDPVATGDSADKPLSKSAKKRAKQKEKKASDQASASAETLTNSLKRLNINNNTQQTS